MICNHKTKGICNIKGCTKSRASKGKCKICGQKRYKRTCRTHLSNGTKIPRTRGKQTTNSVKRRRKVIFDRRKT